MVKEIKIGRRKIKATQYKRIDHGQLKVPTKRGWVKLSDGDWIVDAIDKDIKIIIPSDTLEYLSIKQDEE